jgi:predicted MFS family arabinose efflux permease
LDAGSFLVSAALIGRVGARRTAAEKTTPEQPVTAAAVPAAAPEKRAGAFRAGLAAASAGRGVLSALVSQSASCAAAGASLVLLIPIAHSLAGGDTATGLLTAAIGVGSVVGVPLGGPSAKRERAAVAALCVATLGAFLGLFGLGGGYAPALILGVLLGVAANVGEPIYWTLYGNRVPDEKSGPFYGLVEAIIGISFAVGGTAAGLLASLFGVASASWMVGGAVIAMALFALRLSSRAPADSAAPTSSVLV